MQFFFILFLTTTFIVTTAVSDNSKHLQESSYRNRWHKSIATFPRLKSETIWNGSHQQNRNNGKSTVKATTISKKILKHHRTPGYKEVTLRMDNIFQNNFNNRKVPNITTARVIKPRVLRCPNGFVRNNKNECVGKYSI
jgi:hypothetical protein